MKSKKSKQVSIQKIFFTMIFFMSAFSSIVYAEYQNLDTTNLPGVFWDSGIYKWVDSYQEVSWQADRVLFDTIIDGVPDYAKGHVKFRDGFVVDTGVTVALDIINPINGVIDAGPGGNNVGATGKIRLMSPITLAADASIPNGAMIDGRGNSITFDGNFTLPKNKRLRIMSDTVLDGRNHTFAFEQDAQIIVDHGVTVTLMNMTITNTSSGYYRQIFTPLGPTSRVCLQDVVLELSDNIVFRLGCLYIHGDVIVSGPYSLR